MQAVVLCWARLARSGVGCANELRLECFLSCHPELVSGSHGCCVLSSDCVEMPKRLA